MKCIGSIGSAISIIPMGPYFNFKSVIYIYIYVIVYRLLYLKIILCLIVHFIYFIHSSIHPFILFICLFMYLFFIFFLFIYIYLFKVYIYIKSFFKDDLSIHPSIYLSLSHWKVEIGGTWWPRCRGPGRQGHHAIALGFWFAVGQAGTMARLKTTKLMMFDVVSGVFDDVWWICYIMLYTVWCLFDFCLYVCLFAEFWCFLIIFVNGCCRFLIWMSLKLICTHKHP